MKQIPLTRGMFALVDDCDFEFLSHFHWNAHTTGKGKAFYAACKPHAKGRMVYMHRFILGIFGKPEIDHWDGNTLNNTRRNLRICDRIKNAHNSRTQKHSSRFKGVCWSTREQQWRSTISCTEHGRRKQYHLGFFDVETKAALAYNEAAERFFGVFARLNRVETSPSV